MQDATLVNTCNTGKYHEHYYFGYHKKVALYKLECTLGFFNKYINSLTFSFFLLFSKFAFHSKIKKKSCKINHVLPQ